MIRSNENFEKLFEKGAAKLSEAAGLMSYLEIHTMFTDKDGSEIAEMPDFWIEQGLLEEVDRLMKILQHVIPKLESRIQPVQSYNKEVWDHIEEITDERYNKGARFVEKIARIEREKEKQA